MKKIIVIFLIGLLQAFSITSVFAQTAAASAGTSALNMIIQGTNLVSGSASAITQDLIRRNTGQIIPIVTTAAAGVAGSRLGGLAGGIARAGTGIGIATLVLPWIWDAAGLIVCPPPDFICKKGGTNLNPPEVANSWRSINNGALTTSPKAHCDYWAWSQGQGRTGLIVWISTTRARCDILNSNGTVAVNNFDTLDYMANTVVCPVGTVQTGGQCSRTEPPTPASAGDISGPLTTVLNNDPSKAGQVYDALVKAGVPVLQAGDPVTLSSPLTIAPPQTITRNVDLGSGQTGTQVKTSTSTVTSAQLGNTVGDATLKSTITTTTVTNTTNNTTNVMTTETETEVETAGPEPVKFPTDYNREQTQQKILNEIQGGTAVAPVDDSKAKILQTELDLKNKFESLPGQIAGDKSSWFSWVWVPPVGSCAPNTGTMHGYTVTFDLCPWVNNIRDVIGWLWAMIASIYIYNLMFRSENG